MNSYDPRILSPGQNKSGDVLPAIREAKGPKILIYQCAEPSHYPPRGSLSSVTEPLFLPV